MRRTSLLLVVAAALALAGCGNSTGSRAVTGGLLGAGAGAAIGSTQGSAGTGALIGGGLGALGGAATAR
jgi:hypothetical protein